MKIFLLLISISLWSLARSDNQFLNPYIINLPTSTNAIIPSYLVEGSVQLANSDLTNNIFDYREVFIQSARNKRAKSFRYVTPDSSRSEQFDTYVDPRDTHQHLLNRYQGRVSWTSPEGIPFHLDYVADGSGYHPNAPHLPGYPNTRSFFTTGLGA